MTEYKARMQDRVNVLTKNFKIDEETRRHIEEIVHIYDEHDPTLQESEKASKLVNEVLIKLFKTPYNFLIPFEFVESELGSILFETKFIHQRYYSTQELSIILDQSTSNLYYNNREGNIRMQNRGGVFLTTEGELQRYMKKKNLDDDEIKLRLEAFWSVKKDFLGTKLGRVKLKELYDREVEKKAKRESERKPKKRRQGSK